MSSLTSITVPIETAERDLQHLLEQLHLGETITLVSSEGTPLAVVVSLKPVALVAETPPTSDWEAQWEALAEEVGRAWKSERSAIETLSEMRR
jgi:hypothetical protein